MDLIAHSITIRHPSSDMTKTGYYGFRWTYLLFGFLVPVFRGELLVGALHLLFTIFTGEIWQVVMAFLYNKQCMTRMLTEKGWVLDGWAIENELAKKSLGIVNHIVE
ncbi:MAG: hypothetical protein M0T83_10755 [Nitrospiraceae bacterium]|nr:hypothetical protein [Nitrospiraceae bacterium]